MKLKRIALGVMFSSTFGCSHANTNQMVKLDPGQVPAWIAAEPMSGDTLCGLGVAGAGFNNDSPYPIQLSTERAVQNLAGILGTQVQEAIIDQQTENNTDVQLARVLKVDDALLQQVSAVAKTETWLDKDGQGPYGAKNFTYAHSCLDAEAMKGLHVDPKAMMQPTTLTKNNGSKVPAWLTMIGKQPGGRMCAIGYSMPAFFADQTFQTVVDDVRGQLTDSVQTLVASYYQEVSNEKVQAVEEMTVATTQAISKGAIVTMYWHDRDGIGPNKQKLTTYGWGCLYPVDVLKDAFAAAQKVAPPDQQARIAQVQSRAELAMDALDQEVAKHGTPAPSLPKTAQASDDTTTTDTGAH